MENKINQLDWSDNAKFHLRKVYDFIALDSAFYAERFVSKLVKDVERQLLSFPTSGRLVPELVNSPYSHYREIIYKGYRVVYDPCKMPSKVEIVTIASGRQIIEDQL